jgi:hypothetical protein
LENQKKNNSSAQDACLRGKNIIKKESSGSTDYRILHLWLRLHMCLKQYDTAKTTREHLEKIGYQESNYLQQISPMK